jgi:hypothetical protein
MEKKLAKLKKVDLRKIFPHEANDFSNWLAQQENLDLLSEEVGVEIKLVQTEANVGKFNVDILAEEESSGRKIIIENQLEYTNHDHLGKIITYASGYDAEIIIWIVKNVREEHQKAIEWLNEHTDEKINLFLVKIELWQIKNSTPAPKFEIIVSPNEWAKVLKTSAGNRELTDTKIQQLEFWKKLREYIRVNDIKLRLQTPRAQHWYNFNVGTTGTHVSITINSKENLLGCELYIDKSKELFNYLRERKKEIEKEIGEKAEWIDAPIASRIKISKEVNDVFNQEKAENYFVWIYKKIVLFKKVFGRYINEFKE